MTTNDTISKLDKYLKLRYYCYISFILNALLSIKQLVALMPEQVVMIINSIDLASHIFGLILFICIYKKTGISDSNWIELENRVNKEMNYQKPKHLERYCGVCMASKMIQAVSALAVYATYFGMENFLTVINIWPILSLVMDIAYFFNIIYLKKFFKLLKKVE